MRALKLEANKGNVLFLILVALALFAALTYAVTGSSRSGPDNLSNEQEKLDQAVVDNYLAALNLGRMRLETTGCASIDYTPPVDQTAGDKSCHLFHPDGGQVIYQEGFIGLGCDLDEMTTLGENCNGLVYGGTSGGHKIFTTAKDLGSYSWNNGSTNYTDTGVNSNTDGLTNTDTLVALEDAGAPYQAAEACRSLGPEWYLPAYNELQTLFANKNAIGNFDLSGAQPNGYYLSSTQRDFDDSKLVRFTNGANSYSGDNKSIAMSVRCVKSD